MTVPKAFFTSLRDPPVCSPYILPFAQDAHGGTPCAPPPPPVRPLLSGRAEPEDSLCPERRSPTSGLFNTFHFPRRTIVSDVLGGGAPAHTSKSTGRGGRQNAATRRNMRRDERVTVQGPRKGTPTRRTVTQGGGRDALERGGGPGAVKNEYFVPFFSHFCPSFLNRIPPQPSTIHIPCAMPATSPCPPHFPPFPPLFPSPSSKPLPLMPLCITSPPRDCLVAGRYQLLGAADAQTAHPPPHPAQPRHTNDGAPRTRKRHQQEHRPQRPTERSDPTQHAKGRTGDCPGPP